LNAPFGKPGEPASISGAAAALRRLADRVPGETIAVDDILRAMGNHGFGILVLLLALPNAIPGPMIPGFSVPFALGIGLLGSQILRGERRPLLPAWLRRRVVNRDRFRRFLDRAEPRMRRLEERFRPHSSALMRRGDSRRILGLALMIYAAVLALPIPLGNGAMAFAICVIAFGLLQSDERIEMIGIFGGALAVLFNVGVVVAGVRLYELAARLVG
jgi:hypothetical protein